jgi:hypothetical protein
MHRCITNPSSTHEYKGSTISLLVSEAPEGTWRCRYVYIEFSLTDTAYLSNYPDGLFTTQQEAESAALRKAKKLIDPWEPLLPHPCP